MLIRADARLLPLRDNCVQCVVTSPPYWGLRDYGTGRWSGGDPLCEHRVSGQVADTKAPGAITTGQRPGVDSTTCRTCGARRIDSQIGIEQTLGAYVTQIVGGVALDPFIGSGTVGAVAERLGRRWVGIDLSYQALASARTAQRGLKW